MLRFAESANNGTGLADKRNTMINPVSSVSSTYSIGEPPMLQTPPAVQQRVTSPEDSVHLSPVAQAQAAGDVDHDGDSR